MKLSLRTVLYIADKWHPWSTNVEFRSGERNIGNGERKLACELKITKPVGGQNNTYDLIHDKLGYISVKDVTKDDCILGAEGSQNLRIIFEKTVNLLKMWVEKYKNRDKYVEKLFYRLQKKCGQSRLTLMQGISRLELSKSSLTELNDIFIDVRKSIDSKDNSSSLKSEYIEDIFQYLGDMSLREKCDECVRNEAINNTLIIVHKDNGWMIIKDLSRITCPRITRGSPRININYN